MASTQPAASPALSPEKVQGRAPKSDKQKKRIEKFQDKKKEEGEKVGISKIQDDITIYSSLFKKAEKVSVLKE
jgi:hypothetical protein